jgi:hypothetical protein
VVSGTGTITGNVMNGGQIEPGGLNAAGTLNITGNYSQISNTAAGSLDIDILGHSPGVSYDQVNITGQSRLAGVLNVHVGNGFAPSLGDTYQIMTFGPPQGLNWADLRFFRKVQLAIQFDEYHLDGGK